ncbi:MAG TPA: ATP-binding protein [Burkholderiales bacterium]|nr:ATP-binding protein [Burkholderiales bacterium]
MGALIRAKDWSETPLGPIESWPQSLRSAVSILLPSKAQIILFWGPELVAVYNDAYRPVLGAKHPAAVGVPARQLFSEAWHVLEPLFMGVVNTGETFWAKDHEFALERHGYLEETYFDVSYDPVRDETGRVGGLFCIVSDTTGRIVGERRLAALRDLGGIGAGASTAGEVLRNACSVLERYRKDLPFAALYRGKDLEVSFGIEDPAHRPWPLGGEEELVRAGDAAVLKIATSGREPYGTLVAGINPQRGFDAAYADFFRLVSATIAGAIAAVQALEDERRRAAALAELDRAKTAFFSNVSHEFRTPLTLMLGPLDDLLAKAEGDMLPEDRALLTVAQRNGQRLLKLVNTLLEFARIEAGRAQASYQPTDLPALTADLASNFRSACERAGIRLAVDCPPLPEAAYVDQEMWEKIVLNLLSNAFKFTLEGSISVQLRDAGANFELMVSDTGTGIPAESLPRMFERFHRVEDTRGRSHEGSGIGLALVNELVKLHGGSIAVQSTLGDGTTFTVTIPKGSAHLPANRVRAPREAAFSTASRADAYVAEAMGWLPGGETALTPARPPATHRILVADDNADLREYVRKLLAEHYDVEAVADGQAAIEAASARRPDLVIADVMMPRLDGFGLIRGLRADPKLRAIPVVLLSARAGEEARVEGLGSGADEYLVKPFSSRELLVRVGTLVKSAETHRRANEALAQFETLLNEAPVGVYVVNEAFRIAAMNPVALPVFGEIPDLVGRDFDEVIHMIWPKAYADEIVQRFRHTLETGEPHIVPERIEERLDRKVTEYYEWQINRIPLPGSRQGVVCYFRDISKSVMTREALREADSRKDEFLATLSHELRNPLAPLRSSLEILKLVGTAGPPAATAMEIMERQLSHLVRLVDDLMEVSRITRGNVELRKEPVRLDVALRNAVEASDSLFRTGGHRLGVSIPDEPMVLEADPVRLAQIFGNLLNNAAKYTETGGAITIEAKRESLEAVVVISDTGDGIEPDLLPQLFKIFARGNRSAKRNQSGLGIGLALVRRLTEMHGGRVDAESDGPGKGSRFTVRLPLNPAQQVAPVRIKPDKPITSSVRILVIDDNRDAAESLCILLGQVGAEVRVAHDGPEALAAFAVYRPDVVLLDIGMPGMSGYEVARRIRASQQEPRASIVALTGWGQDEDRRRVREAGFDHHLVKPADLEALRSLIASIQTNRARPAA